ncbi:MAG TPA: hypothetical protein PK598_00975, partial [Thermoanaerobaculia bacterium]|nr:hypothetical protein [Thermoanaerobaculia bacterium]
GRTGRKVGAGRSGGVSWVLDVDGNFAMRSNMELVSIGPVTDSTAEGILKELVRRHAAATRSEVAKKILDSWETVLPKFVQVLPNDYRRVLEAQARMREKGLPEDEAVLAAFEENARSPVRVSGS